jgi:DNA-binding CsgD family transcriptional regulator
VAAQAGILDETDVIARAVGDLARQTRFPVAFGGLEHDGAVHVTSVVGARGRSIDGLVVEAHRGLGGRALVEKRARLALDYRTSRSITHDYDRAILGEGISTLFAVPIVVGGISRGVLYCASWQAASVGDVVAQPAFRVAADVATELRVRDEVDRRLTALPAPSAELAGGGREELRETYAEIRRIAATVHDDVLRTRLESVEKRLAALARGGDPVAAELDVPLSPREIDVLACAAQGATNAEVAASLGLRETTVKSYLASAMAKLDASTRHSAVTKARRAGVLP